ncbi:hypothetical protein WIS52_01345 [Pseudonocardia nematodicida]|uniref:Polysaccharide chain length determinant N-terminal domain-containing protein n=1 Tax=Pseudonocardia nematodicida TaxID=1206997 RepID=A0ABV1K3R9_9PSEU
MRDTQAEEAELGFWWRVIRHRWWIVAVTVVLVTGVAVGAVAAFVPGHTATARISVAGGDVLAERQFLEGSTVRDAVAARLGEMPDVTVSGAEGESLLTVSAAGPSAERAVEIANTYAEVGIAERVRSIGVERAATQAAFEQRIAEIDAQRVTAPPGELTVLDRQRVAYVESATAARSAVPPPVPVLVDPASVSGVTGPDLLVVAIGAALLAALAGTAAAGVAEHGDRRVRTADGAGAALPAAPLGSVPGAEPGVAAMRWRSLLRLGGGGTAAEPGSAAADAVSVVRQRMQNRGHIKPKDAIAIFALDPRDARHAVAVGIDLARSIVRSGRSVLLLSADLRGGDGCLARLHLYEDGPGLSEVLRGADAGSAVQPTTTEGLSVLAAGSGTASPYDDLQSERFGSVVAELRLNADLLVVVAPPLSSHPDALAVAEVVDTRMAVVGPEARRPVLEDGARELERNGIALDGFLFAGRARV